MPEDTQQTPVLETQTPSAAEVPKPAPTPEILPSPKSNEQSASSAARAIRIGGDDDAIPETDELLELSKTALQKRLARHTKSQLREEFGTDNFGEIKAKLEKLAALEAEKEERRKAALTEKARMKEELEQAKARQAEAEQRAEAIAQVAEYEKIDNLSETVISGYVAPKYAKIAEQDLRAFITRHDDDDPALANPKQLFESWAKEFIEEHPEFAPTREEPRKVRLSNGAEVPRPDRRDDDTTKTIRPGPKSMSKAEYAAYKRARGLSS